MKGLNKYSVIKEFIDVDQITKTVGSIIYATSDRGTKLIKNGLVTLLEEYTDKLVKTRYRGGNLELFNSLTGEIITTVDKNGIDDVKALEAATTNLKNEIYTKLNNEIYSPNFREVESKECDFYTNNGTKKETDLDNSRIFTISAGDKLHVVHSARQWIDIYAFLDKDKNVISNERWISDPVIVERYLVAPSKAAYILLSGGKNDIANSTVTIIHDSVKEYEKIEPEWTEGKYINVSGNIATAATYKYSEPILVQKNQKIIVSTAGYNSNVAIISRLEDDGSRSALVSSFDSEYRRFEYLANENVNIVVSGHTKKGMEITLKKSDVNNISKDVIKMMNTAYFAGDSITRGYRKSGYTDTEKTWVKYLAKYGGFTPTIVATSGWTAKGWWDETNDTMDMSTMDCAFIKLGQNGSLTDTVTEDASGTNYTTYSDTTNTGCYCKIVGKMISQNSKIKIFIIPTQNRTTAGKTNNRVLKNIANKFSSNCFYIDIHNHDSYDTDDEIYHQSETGESYDVHFNTLGNIVLAKVIYDKLCEVIDHNIVKFYDF